MWKHASINRAYRLVWNCVQQAFVPAPETARGHSAGGATRARTRRGGGIVPSDRLPLWRVLNVALALAGLLVSPLALALDAGALPQGGSVAAGAANIAGSGNALTVTQSSDRAIVNWQSFDVGQNAGVRFVQPSTTAATLNRVTGGPASQILGTLSANGQVYLVNPAGVLFGATAQVNVGSLVASTLRIADNDFLAGRDRFTLDGATGEVSNQGRITAAQGGRVALLGARVTNTGTLHAPLGNVALAAGRQITLSAGANGHLQIAVDPADLATQVHNGGLIQAEGGQVILTAQGADALASSVVSHTGTVQAQTVATREGRILLLADPDRGTTKVAGTLDASAPHGGNGGFIETSAARVKVADSATVTTRAGNGTTGTWLIDPNDFTIAAAGGDMTGAAVSTALQNTDFQIQSVRGSTSGKGDIFVNDTVSWSANTLTLTAERDIQINAALNGSNTAGLALKYGQGALAANNTATYQVRAPVNLASTGRFSTTLGSDGATLNYTILTRLGEQGSTSRNDLQGINGNMSGRYVLGSDIDASATREWYGGAGFSPIGYAENTPFRGTFDGLGHAIAGLTINRPGQNHVGLFGFATNATIRHVGLDRGSVSGNAYVGGLVGYNLARDGTASLDHVWSSANVTGQGNYVGGLVGRNYGFTGGTARISNAYATGAVEGGDSLVGGLVGENSVGRGTASINNVYATGAVKGKYNVGGLVGHNASSAASISKAYATGAVTANGNAGGLVGQSSGSITNSYWDRFSTKQNDGVGAGGSWNLHWVTSDPAQSGAANYAFKVSAYTNNLGEDAVATSKNAGASWYMINGQTRPFLASEYSTTVTNAHQLQLMAMDLGANYTLARNIDARATGLNDGTAKVSGGMWTMAGFSPIGGGAAAPFKGTFDGQGHVISGLTVNRPSQNYVGLFGRAQNATIRNVGLDRVSVSGGSQVGGLVGHNYAYSGAVYLDNVWVTGKVAGGGREVGGLVGTNEASFGAIDISNAYATGAVTGTDFVGGLVGWSLGNGGHTARISDAYATGAVTSSGFFAGGLVGLNDTNSIINNSYWDIGTTGRTAGVGGGNSAGVIGKTSEQLKDLGTYADWSIDSQGGTDRVWRIYDGDTMPLLRSFLKPVTVTANNADKTYDGLAWSGDNGVTQSDPNASLAGTLRYTGNAQGAINANADNASYAITPGGQYSSQQGYDITFVDGHLTIGKAPLTITALDKGKTYDGLTYTGSYGVTYDGFVNNETSTDLTGTLTYGGSAQDAVNAGRYTITASGHGATNYDIAYVNGTLTVDKAPITVTATSGRSTYGDAPSNPGFTATGLVSGQDVSVLTGLANSFGIDRTTDADKYTLTVTGDLAEGNYRVIERNVGSWVVDAKDITVTATSGRSTYGDTPTNPGFTADGLVNGQNVSVLTGLANSFGIDRTTDVDKYTLTVTGDLAKDNYRVIERHDGNWVVDAKDITVTATSGRSIYGDTPSNPGFTATGLVNGQDVSVLSGLTNSFGIDRTTNADDYVLTVTGDLAKGNYRAVERNDGTWIVDAKDITVTATSGRSTYGDSPTNPGFTAVGLVNDQDASVLAGLTNNFGIDSHTNADDYVLTVTGALTNGNYRVTKRNVGAWVVHPKDITVTATSGRSTYGDTPTNPGFTAVGLVNDQDVSVLSGLTSSFGIDHDTDAGRHTLRVDGVLTNGNYTITERRDGTWVVDPKNITVTANGGRSTYGDTKQANPGLTANGLVNGQDVSVLTGLTNGFGIDHDTNAGSHTLRVDGVLTNGNYTVTESRDGTWIVDPARLFITANNATRIANGIPYRGGNGVGYAGFVNGEDASVLEGALAYGGSAQGATQPGVYDLTAEGLRSGNYRIEYRDGSLTIGAAQGLLTAGQLENGAIDERYADRHDTPFGPRPSRLTSLSQPDQGPSRLPLSFAENFIRVGP